MQETLTPTRSYPLGVIMQRTVLSNRWITEQWEAIGVVRDTAGGEPRIIVENDALTQMLFPGYRLTLVRDEAEGYYLNLTSPEPKIFILWRPADAIACPD